MKLTWLETWQFTFKAWLREETCSQRLWLKLKFQLGWVASKTNCVKSKLKFIVNYWFVFFMRPSSSFRWSQFAAILRPSTWNILVLSELDFNQLWLWLSQVIVMDFFFIGLFIACWLPHWKWFTLEFLFRFGVSHFFGLPSIFSVSCFLFARRVGTYFRCTTLTNWLHASSSHSSSPRYERVAVVVIVTVSDITRYGID